jgi:hypothetical protein
MVWKQAWSIKNYRYVWDVSAADSGAIVNLDGTGDDVREVKAEPEDYIGSA